MMIFYMLQSKFNFMFSLNDAFIVLSKCCYIEWYYIYTRDSRAVTAQPVTIYGDGLCFPISFSTIVYK